MNAAPAEAAPPCPCGSTAGYGACCGRYHEGSLRGQAPTAETLMRSRYCAYVLGLSNYLRESWHASTRPPKIEQEPGIRWLGLEVRRHAMQDAEHATVEFVARSKLHGRAQRLHEVSRFVLEDGRWFYVDGDLR